MKKFIPHSFIFLSAVFMLSFFVQIAQCQWVQSKAGSVSYLNCVSANGTDIFAGSPGGVFYSSDNGADWIGASSGLTDKNIYSLAHIGTNLFAGGSGGTYLSTNKGASWIKVTAGLTNPSVNNLIAVGTKLFAATSNIGIALSTDNGTSWNLVNAGITKLNFGSLAASNTKLFIGGEDGVYLSTDGAASWTLVNSGNTGGYVQALAVIGSALFAGTATGGVFVSTDDGTSWKSSSVGMIGANIYALVSIGNDLFATADGGVFRSSDNAATWTAVNLGLTEFNSVGSLTMNATHIFTGAASGVWRRPLADFGLASVTESQVNASSITVSPNPTSGIITIHNSASEAKHITLSNMLGVSVMDINEFARPDFTLDLSKLTPGSYILKLSEGGSVTIRMIVRQ